MNALFITYDGVFDVVSQSQVIPYMEQLAKAGNKISVLSFEKTTHLKNNAALQLRMKRFGEHGIKWSFLRYHKTPAIPATVFDMIRGVFTGSRIARRERVSVVHARGYISMIIACGIKSFYRTKVIFDMRGFWPEEKVDAGVWKEGSILYRVLKAVEKYLLKNADEIIVLTKAAKKVVEATVCRAPVTIIPCCTDTGLFKPAPKSPARPTIVYAGSLGTFYDSDEIFELFKVLKKSHAEAFLWIVSQSPKDSVTKAAASMGIDPASYGVGVSDYGQMPKVFAKADFSIIFYKRRLSGAGCSPIKFAESLACGVPVIISRGIGDCDDIVEKFNVGAVVKEFTVSGYAAALEKIDRFLAEGESARTRCRAVAENLFSLESGVKLYKELYKRMEENVR